MHLKENRPEMIAYRLHCTESLWGMIYVRITGKVYRRHVMAVSALVVRYTGKVYRRPVMAVSILVVRYTGKV